MSSLLVLAGIRLDATASSQEEAVRLCGSVLQELDAVGPEYPDAMVEREKIISSYMGEGVALPHGTDDSRKYVNFTQLVFVRFANDVDWEGERVRLCIGVAAKADEHGELLGNIANKLLDESSFAKLMNSNSEQEILDLLNS